MSPDTKRAIEHDCARSITAFFTLLDAANFEADAELEVGGHQGAELLVDDRLQVAKDRFDVLGRHGGAGKLTGREETLPFANHLHARSFFLND